MNVNSGCKKRYALKTEISLISQKLFYKTEACGW